MRDQTEFNTANSKLLDRVMPLPVILCWGVAVASASRPWVVLGLGVAFFVGNLLINVLVTRQLQAGGGDLSGQGWARLGLMALLMPVMTFYVGPDGAWWLPPIPGLMAVPLLLSVRSALIGGLAVLGLIAAARAVAFGGGGLLAPLVANLVALAFMLPVTATLRERERQLVAMADALAGEALRANAASHAKSTFLAHMSHEIRTPLSGITSALQLVTIETDPGAQRALLSAAAQSAAGLRELLDGVLDLSKIEAGEMTVEQLPTSIRALRQQINAAFLPIATEKGVTLAVSIADGVPAWGLCDPVRLRQIAFNLTSNALKFTERGAVSVSVGFEEGRLLLSVADTGEGIAPERIGRIFNNFQQADETTTRRHGGTGLGLALVRELVGLLGGTIDVESAPGEGSCFTAVLPWTPCEAPREAAADSLPQLGLRVLVAEDNAINRLVIQRQLTQLGCTFAAAVDGEEALRALRREAFDVLLLDCHMPVRDGFSVAAEARQEGLELPIIALTASALRSVQERCVAAGMDDFLTKPVDMHTLAERLQASGVGA